VGLGKPGHGEHHGAGAREGLAGGRGERDRRSPRRGARVADDVEARPREVRRDRRPHDAEADDRDGPRRGIY
jgi:hypothetical protein